MRVAVPDSPGAVILARIRSMTLKHRSISSNLLRFRLHLSEYKKFMPPMAANIEKSMEIATEVTEYIREKCESENWTELEKLDEVERDIAIYRSRSQHIMAKFNSICAEFEEANKIIKTAEGKTRMSAVFERFCLFVKERQENIKALGRAEKRWLKTENFILSHFKSE